jgi:hypothetical protein
MTDPSIDARIASARTELEETLDAIEDKLNVPRRIGGLARQAREAYDKNPVPWIASAATFVVVAGLVTWAVLRRR